MKIGNMHVQWTRPKTRRQKVREIINDYVASREVREMTAKIARSEVKSYLQDLSEDAGRPYTGPVEFIQDILPTHNED